MRAGTSRRSEAERRLRIVEALRQLDDGRIAARAHVVQNRTHALTDLARRIPAAGVERRERPLVTGVGEDHA